MTLIAAAPVDPVDDSAASGLLAGGVSRRRRLTNAAFTGAMCAAALLAAVPLVSVLVALAQKAGHLLSVGFFVDDIPRVTNLPPAVQAKLHLSSSPAVGPAIIGTLVVTLGAAVLAIPFGVMGAVYLNEYGRQGLLARLIRFMADVMIGVPSVIMGLFVYTVLVLRTGQSGLAGALALACLMLPIVIRTSEEMLKLVPDELRHASDALGGRTWHRVGRVVLPAALPGLTSGSMLAVARAAGETAPLLFTIGVVNAANPSLSGPNTALSAQIFSNAKLVNPLANDLAWGAALTLVALVFLLTAGARFVSHRFASARRA